MGMKQIDVEIMGQSYRLSCPTGGEARLQQAVERVDAAMCKIRDSGKIRARDRIAVLAALNLAFDIADQAATKSTVTNTLTHPASGTNNSSAIPFEKPDTANNAKLQNLILRLDAALQSTNDTRVQ